MAEDEFTPTSGIKVNINVLPGGNTTVLLLSCTSGRTPDVALGVPSAVPVDYAIRGALADLSKFPDYKEIAKRFRPGALIPFKWQGGAYALPEDQDFLMLFYRIDVMEQLGIKKIPQTWEDVYKMLPVLQQAGMDFYFPPGTFTPFLFQRGATYYNENGTKSALDTPEAMKAFEEWTDLYTKYKIQKQADFFNRMRTGEMPIGVANYYTYILLSTAAPELTGWWKMAPMPGIRKPDGSIDRSNGGGSNTAIIFNNSKKKEAAWEFIKWWTSTSAQVRFGSELEGLLGTEARWNTANIEALQMLPWPKDDIKAVFEQWKWFQETPVVLGGYFTGRHITNAWNRVVLQGMNPREALEMAVKDINKELTRKQEEFGVKPESAKPVQQVAR
jgi:ABC-type glycerol-3-phosphate transport system substrate-binding protein